MTQFVWKSGTTGDWNTAADWVGGVVANNAAADVTISNGTAEISSGETETVDSITLSSSAATLQVQGLLELGGSKASLLVSNGALDLLSGGTIANGTISAGTGAVMFGTDTMLDAITYLGNLSIAAGQVLDTEGGLAVKTAAGALPGTINIGTNGAVLDAEVNETINSVVINLGEGGGGAYLEHDRIGDGGVLVLGKSVTLNAIGANDEIYDDGGATIIIDGIINVEGAGFLLNNGVSFANAGTINIAAGASLTETETKFTNAGTIFVNGGTLVLDSAVTLSSLGSISLSATSLLDAAGTMSLGGLTLALTQGTFGGAFANGTLKAGAGTFADNTILDAITYLGNLSIAAGQVLDTAGSLAVKTAAGAVPGTINIGTNGAVLDAEGNETINSVVINLGEGGGGAYLEHDRIGDGGVLVLGNAVTLNAIGANDEIYDDGGATIINDGIINVEGAGFLLNNGASFANAGTINIAAGASLTENETRFTNTGTIHVNGGTLVLDSAVTLSSLGSISLSATSLLDAAGTLSLGGLTLGLMAGTLAGAVANGTIKGGTVTFATDTMLDAITYLGNLSIAAGQVLDTEGGLAVKTAAGALPGTINIGTNGAVLDAEVNETINSVVINLGEGGGGAYLEHDRIGDGGVLVLGKSVTLNAIGANDEIYDDGGATIIIDGIINVEGAGFLLNNGVSFANAGTINIAAGASLTETETKFTNAGTIFVNGGTLVLDSAVTLSSLGSISLSATSLLDAAGTMSLGGLTLALTQGTFGGAFANGTLKAGAGTFADNTILDAITYLGNLSIAAGQVLDTAGSLAVKTAAGAVPGTINIGTNGAVLDAEGNETINSVVINLGEGGGGAYLEHDRIGDGGVLVLGNAVTLNAIGANDEIYDDGGATIINDGIINVEGAGFLLNNGASFANAGTINIAAGGTLTESTATFTNIGLIEATGTGRMVFLGPVGGSGTIGIAAGASAVLDAGASASQKLSFLASSGELTLGSPATFLGTIAGFTGADKIDLLDTTATKLAYAGGKLSVLDGTATIATLTLSGSYALKNFVLGSDHQGGALITWHS